MKKILAQAMKEFRLFRRDKLLILLAVLMPIVLMLLAGITGTLRLRNVSLLVYDYDNTMLSRTYLETYGAALTFRMKPHPPGESPERALASWRGRAALIIPQNFERDYRRGTQPSVQLMIDATDSNAATALGNYAQALNANFAVKNGLTRPPAKGVRLEQRFWYNPGLSDRVYFGTGGLGLMLIIFPALLGALTTAKEYETGTIIQAYASSLTAVQWILGKGLLYVVIGLVEFVLCFALGLMVFEFRFPTDPSVLLLATVFYLLAGVFFGMMMGNASKNQSAAIQGVQMGSFLLSLLLSGYLLAIRNIPVQIRWLSDFLPATHYIQIVRNSILRNAGWGTSFYPMVMLVVLAFAFFAVNVLQMRKMQFKG
ncbi:MAG TPA: ABC transporter permease [Terriglobales bacterium]|nr:ABC transporter permease [Terriglobales bacterium]